MEKHKSERGAAAVLIAGSLVLLLGFAAIAIDSGSALSVRRQLQGAVDAGTLSAGLGTRFDQVQTGCAASGSLAQTSACNGALVAFDIINQTADTPFALNQFADGTRCANSAFEPEYWPGNPNDGVVPRTTSGLDLNCIRFTENFAKIKVLLPVDDVPTTFGRVLNRNSIGVSAYAEAELTYQRPGTVIPFVVGPTGAGTSHGCLFESGGKPAYPCDGPDDGNFGYMDPRLYGDDVLGTPINCGQNQADDRIGASFAKGADHYYAVTTEVAGSALDIEHCPNKNQPIDTINVQPGGTLGGLVAGAFEGRFGTEGRLACKDGDSAEPAWFGFESRNSNGGQPDCMNVSGNRLPEDLDNTPIWEHMIPVPAVGTNATVLALCNAVVDKASAEACLDAWKANPPTGNDLTPGTVDDPRLFSDDLSLSPRFAWVPRIGVDPHGNAGDHEILDFLPIYIQTLQWKCTNIGCDVTFDPGEACDGCPFTKNKQFDGMTGFILARSMLPDSIRNFPDADGQLTYNLSQ